MLWGAARGARVASKSVEEAQPPAVSVFGWPQSTALEHCSNLMHSHCCSTIVSRQ